MVFTVRFLYDDEGDLKMGGIQEVLGEDNIRNILNTQIHQTIRLGIAPDKKAYRVIKVVRHAQGDDLHMDITVTDISDKKKPNDILPR